MDTESKSTIKNYFALLDFFMKASRGAGNFSYVTGEVTDSGGMVPKSSESRATRELRAQALSILGELKGAKIFSIPFSVYSEVWDAVDRFVVEDAGCAVPEAFMAPKILEANKNLNSSQPLDPYVVRLVEQLDMQMDLIDVGDDEELPHSRNAFVEGLLDPWMEYMNQWPHVGRRYPTKMPFELTYLGYGEGIELSSFQLDMRFRDRGMYFKNEALGSDHFHSYKILGHLLNANGEAWELSSYTIPEPLVIPANIPKVGGRTMSISGSELESEVYAYFKEGMKSPKYRALLNSVFKQFNSVLTDNGYRPLTGEYSDYTLYATRHEEYGDAWTFGKLVEGFAYYSSHVGPDSPEYARAKDMGEVDPSGYWCNPWSLAPWIVPTMVDLINENNKTFVFKGTYDSSTRKEVGKNHKRLVKRRKNRPVLPAYYIIDVKPKIVRARSSEVLRQSSSGGQKLKFRHDRDGHERVLVKRGKLPLLEDDQSLLEARGYTLYVDSQPLDKDRDRLIRRRLPMRNHGEWLAMKTSWVKESVVGDESLPYKPAVRRLSTESIADLVRGN